MRYLVALIWPPLAVIICASNHHVPVNLCLWFGGLLTLWLSFPLAFLLWLTSLIHAMAVVQLYYKERRAAELVEVAAATKAGVLAALEAEKRAANPAPSMPSNYDQNRDVYKL